MRAAVAAVVALVLGTPTLGAAAVSAATAAPPYVKPWHVSRAVVGTASVSLGSLDTDTGLVATPLQHGTRITLLDAARRRVVWSVVTKATAVVSPAAFSAPTDLAGRLPSGPIVLRVEFPRTRIMVLSRATGRVLAKGPIGFDLLGSGRSDDPGALKVLRGDVLLSDGATIERLDLRSLHRRAWSRSESDCGSTTVGGLIVGGDHACSVSSGAGVAWQGAAGSAAYSFGGHLIGFGGSPSRWSILDPATGAATASFEHDEQGIALASQDLFLMQAGSKIQAIDLGTGRQRWVVDGTLTQAYPRILLPVASGAILMSIDGSKQYQEVLDASTGAVRGRIRAAGSADGDSPMIALGVKGGTLHLARNLTGENLVTAIDLAAARTRWTYRFSGTALQVGSRIVVIREKARSIATLVD